MNKRTRTEEILIDIGHKEGNEKTCEGKGTKEICKRETIFKITKSECRPGQGCAKVG